MEFKKREVAYIVKISQIKNAEKEILDGKLKELRIKNRIVARVSIIGTVTDKFESLRDKKYASITINDGEDTIRAKTFGDGVDLLENINKDDIVKVIGFVRYFKDELYITPEIIKKVDARWLMLRKLELIRICGSEKKDVREKEIRKGNEYNEKLENEISKPDKEGVGNQGNHKISGVPENKVSSDVVSNEEEIKVVTEKTEIEYKDDTIKTEEKLEESVKIESKSTLKEEIKEFINQNINTNKSVQYDLFGKPVEEKDELDIEEEKIDDIEIPIKNSRLKIVEKIKEMEKISEDKNVDIDKLILSLDLPVEEINEQIEILLEEGIVYEPKPGKLKSLG